MLRFLVFDEQGAAAEWPLVNAHLLGADDSAMAGRVSFKRGVITCKAGSVSVSVALALEVDAGKAGTLMLQTCLLRQREEPYRLYQELARHRLKLFLEKGDSWGLLDQARAPEAIEFFERARKSFVAGMLERDAFQAEMRHRDALALATFATDRLITYRVDEALRRRFARQGTPRALGIRAPIEKAPELLGAALHKEFDIVTVPTPWSLIEPTQGRFVWDQVDRWMAWAKRSGRSIIAGPLLDAGPNGVPGWARVMLSDPAKIRDRLHDFVTQVVTRYGPLGSGLVWNVASHVHLNQVAQLSLDDMVAVTRMAAVPVKQLQRDAKLLVEIGDPFNDIAPTDEPTSPVNAIIYLRRLISEGIRVDSVGIPVLVGENAPGRGSRDLMQVAAMLDRFSMMKEMPGLIVTALGAPSSAPSEPGVGSWREPWSPRSQGAWASMAFQVAMANHRVQFVVWDRLRDDAGSGIRAAGLFAADGTPKPAAEQLLLHRRRLRSALVKPDASSVPPASKD
jgi:hypothetical protein